MPTVHKTVLLPYSAQQMFDLVHQVEAYPQFLPWCGGARVLARETDAIVARVEIDYHGIHQAFTTRNQFQAPQEIRMALVDGPFSQLDGLWRFTTLRADACKVEFSLDYAFGGGLLGKALTPVFGRIAKTMVDAFVQRAESVYVS